MNFTFYFYTNNGTCISACLHFHKTAGDTWWQFCRVRGLCTDLQWNWAWDWRNGRLNLWNHLPSIFSFFCLTFLVFCFSAYFLWFYHSLLFSWSLPSPNDHIENFVNCKCFYNLSCYFHVLNTSEFCGDSTITILYIYHLLTETH